MSIAIVCMVNNTALSELSHSSSNSSENNATSILTGNQTNAVSNDQCPTLKHSSIDGPFLYDKSTQGLILSSYFYGYTVTQVEFWIKCRFMYKSSNLVYYLFKLKLLGGFLSKHSFLCTTFYILTFIHYFHL
jgi:hypothetical protein